MAADQRFPRLTLVSGPAASGKSRWAEHLAEASALTVVYLATGPHLPGDADWQARIERHRSRRPPHWRSLEVGGEAAAALGALRSGELGLLDSLGTWVAAHLEQDGEEWGRRCRDLRRAIHTCRAPLVLVCEETGWGVVPATAAGGCFRTRLARLQRQLTDDCDVAWLVLQGRALDLLSISVPVPPDIRPGRPAGRGQAEP